MWCELVPYYNCLWPVDLVLVPGVTRNQRSVSAARVKAGHLSKHRCEPLLFFEQFIEHFPLRSLRRDMAQHGRNVLSVTVKVVN